MSKRLFFIAVIIMLVFGLSACGSGEDPVAIIAVNNPIGDAVAYDKLVFTYDERDNIAKDLGTGVSIQRYKGLGEMNAIQLWDTTMNPEFRTFRKVTIDNAVEADRVFSMLMGDEVPPRREFIEKNATYANIDV